MISIIKYGNFKTEKKSELKKQIILLNSYRNANEYLTALKYRHNGKYNKIPNYFINRDGKVLKLLDDNEYSDFFFKNDINRNGIFISLENFGWLEKVPFNNGYINWIGDIYKSKVFERKWRDYFYWEPYTDDQIISLVDLCKLICENNKIKKQSLGHNTKINGVENYEGIITRSNYLSEITDLSPAFDFELFGKLLEDEQT